MSNNYVYDYYRITVPGEAFETLEEAKHHAIDEARERAKLWCVPCEWVADLVHGDIGYTYHIVFQVRRKRNRK